MCVFWRLVWIGFNHQIFKSTLFSTIKTLSISGDPSPQVTWWKENELSYENTTQHVEQTHNENWAPVEIRSWERNDVSIKL